MWKSKDFYSVNCQLCSLTNVLSGHETTDRHLKNVALFEFAENRAEHDKASKNIKVFCSVESSFAPIFKSLETKLKVSSRPAEEVIFDFTISNGTETDIFFYFAQLGHEKHNFNVQNHGLGVGGSPQLIHPSQKLSSVQNPGTSETVDHLVTDSATQNDQTYYMPISVEFASSDIGQFECPLIFYFKKESKKPKKDKEDKSSQHTLVIKDLCVFVEDVQSSHEIKPSPFLKKSFWWGDKLYKSSTLDYLPRYNHDLDEYCIPKHLKLLFASKLTTSVDAPNRDKVMAHNIIETFAIGCKDKENYSKYFHYLLWYEETILIINLKRYNMSEVPLLPTAESKIFMLGVPGLSENRPSVLIGDVLCVKPLKVKRDCGFEGVVCSIVEDTVYITGFHTEFFKLYTPNTKFDVRFFICRLSLERMHRVLERGIARGEMETRTFPEANKIIPAPIKVKTFFNPLVGMNDEQKDAVQHIMAKTCGTAPYLIHGPPGTGKTITIVETILQLVKANINARIMVCTDSNMAADHVASHIIKYAHLFTKDKFLLRANSNIRNWDSLPCQLHCYSNGVSYSTWEHVSLDKFRNHRIVVTTLTHSSKYAMMLAQRHAPRYITHLFIDEAAQAMEPLTLLPVCGLLHPRGVLVLAGDHMQLGPVVISHEAKRLGLGVSLMERLKNTCDLYKEERMDKNYMMMLRNNFRSHPDILSIPNALFYDGKLRALAEEDPISRLDILEGGYASRALVFHGLLSSETKQGYSPSYSNEMEFCMVQKYIHALVQEHKVPCWDIGVVTPYIRQRHLIDKWVKSRNYEGIEVGTVEAYQGKEKRIIIISTVRANASLLDYDAKYQLGFLVDDKRFNVAITRAKAKCVIIGNPLCLSLDQKWKHYMNLCREFGTYRGFDAENANNDLAHKDILKMFQTMSEGLNMTAKVKEEEEKKIE